jgi:hypothetical protein
VANGNKKYSLSIPKYAKITAGITQESVRRTPE